MKESYRKGHLRGKQIHEFFTCKNTNLYISSRPICKVPVNTQTTIRSCLLALSFDLTTLIEMAV